MSQAAWAKATKGLPTKSAKIRALDALGVPRAEIARFLDIRYQHVRNVLTAERPASPRHVEEAATAYGAGDEQASVLADGSVRIPAGLAVHLGASLGEALVALPTDGGLWIATRKASRAHAQLLVQAMLPSEGSHVDAFIQWRREEAEKLDRKFSLHDTPSR